MFSIVYIEFAAIYLSRHICLRGVEDITYFNLLALRVWVNGPTVTDAFDVCLINHGEGNGEHP